MMKISLSEDLKYWRAERPDEWTMDIFIRKARKLEEINKQLLEALELAKKIIDAQMEKIESEWGEGGSAEDIFKKGEAPEGYSTIIAAIAAAKGE